MVDTVQVDKDELWALIERALFTTKDRECYDRARQILVMVYGEKE